MTKKVVFHPLADAYRLMGDEELRELADDVREHGLLEPIVLHEGKILDGRNRYRACGEAGTEPITVEWSGECGSPEAFVLAKHTRRNVTKGQHAMAVARIYPDGGRGKGKDPASKTLKISDIATSYVRQARYVLREAPDLADSVTVGAVALNVAYVETHERRRAASGEESRLKRLTEQYPELAELVEQGELTLAGAEAEADERERKEKEHSDIATMNLKRGVDLVAPMDDDVDAYIEKCLPSWRLDEVDVNAVDRAGKMLCALAAQMRGKKL